MVLSGILKRVVTVALFLGLIALILFLAAGTFECLWVWVYLGILIVSSLTFGVITILTNPETVAERGEFKLTQKWDRIISLLIILAMYIALPLVVGLDIRFSWTPKISYTWHLFGVVILLIGLGISGWAMIENTYFSTAVRIQSDRGQVVCSSGPYRIVRHPGYVGFILHAISVPFLFGSLWGLVPAISTTVVFTIRTSLEDCMLKDSLPGYLDYAQKVRFRLVPGVW